MAEAAHLQYVLSVLSHAGVIGVNWPNVAEENGVGYARNCLQKFKDTVSKYGYTFQNNELTKNEGFGEGAAAAAAATKPKPKRASHKANPTTEPKTTKTATPRKVTPKKRKMEEALEEDSEHDGE